jgi:hypothetical protein
MIRTHHNVIPESAQRLSGISSAPAEKEIPDSSPARASGMTLNLEAK